MVDENRESKETLFHGGFLYIVRLDKLLAGLDQITFQRDTKDDKIINFKKNFYMLKSLYKELHPKMEDEQKERQEIICEQITKEYRAVLKVYDRQSLFNEAIFDLFDGWELELRTITEEKGLLMPDKEDEAWGALK